MDELMNENVPNRTSSIPSHRGSVSTPLVELPQLLAPWSGRVWAKMESWQPTGSTKERSAQTMLDAAERSGRLRPGAPVVESTSGNLGVALARQCLLRGHPFVAVVDDRTNALTLRMLAVFGARVEVVSVRPGEDRLAARLARVAELLGADPAAVNLDQYSNEENPRAHAEGTMVEIVEALDGTPPTHLYVAASTGGTLLGCQRAIEANGWDTRLVAVDAVGSTLFGGTAAPRHLPGLGAGVESEHARRVRPDQVCRIDEADMVRGCRMLVQREGLVAGASTGAIVAAVARDLDRLPASARVVLMVHDAGAAYLETVYDDDWVRRTLTDPERALGDPVPGSFSGGAA